MDTTSGTGPGAAKRDYGRVLYESSHAPALLHPIPWDDLHPSTHARWNRDANAVRDAVLRDLTDHAADPGARRDRVAEIERAARELLDVLRARSIGHDWSAVDDAAESLEHALAAPDQPAGTEGSE